MSTEHMPTIRVLRILSVLAAENTRISLTQLAEDRHLKRHALPDSENSGRTPLY